MYVYRQTGYRKGQIIFIDRDGVEHPMPEKAGMEQDFISEVMRMNRETREDMQKGYY